MNCITLKHDTGFLGSKRKCTDTQKTDTIEWGGTGASTVAGVLMESNHALYYRTLSAMHTAIFICGCETKAKVEKKEIVPRNTQHC